MELLTKIIRVILEMTIKEDISVEHFISVFCYFYNCSKLYLNIVITVIDIESKSNVKKMRSGPRIVRYSQRKPETYEGYRSLKLSK